MQTQQEFECEFKVARRNIATGEFIYAGFTTNGLFWQRLIALRIRNGVYQGKLLNTGKWVEITRIEERR